MSLRNQRHTQGVGGKLARNINVGLFAFGAIFFTIGLLVVSALAGPMLWTGIASQQWLPVEAEVLEAGLHVSHGKSPTWKAWGRYRYEVNGQVYENDRVALMIGSDNMGDFQQRLARELEAAFVQKRPVTVWYDPEDPASSVLNREMRWGILAIAGIFLLMFGGAGLGVMLFAVRGTGTRGLEALRAMQNRAAAKPQRPMPAQSQASSQPFAMPRSIQAGSAEAQRGPSGIKAGHWLENPVWRGGPIQSNAAQKLRFHWLFGGFLLFVTLLFQFASQEFLPDKDGFDQVIRLGILMAALGVLAVGMFKRQALRRYGPGLLRLDPFPGAIDGEVGGTIELELGFHSGMRAELTLRCLEWATEGRIRGEAPIWESRGCAKGLPTAKGSRFGFRFQIPEGLPETSMERKGTFYLWRLQLRVTSPETRLEREFELPVFATGAKATHPQPLATEICPELVAASDISRVLPLERLGSQQRIHYPMGRKAFRALMFVALGLVSIVLGFVQIGWSRESANDWPLFLIFGFIGLVTLLIGLWWLLNSLEVRLDGRSLVSCRRLLGIPVRRREATYAELGPVEVNKGVSTTKSNKQREVEYRLSVSSPRGRLALAENIYIRHQAEEAKRFFEAEFRKGQGYQR